MQDSHKAFLTVFFEYYNFFNKKVVEKKIILYSEEGKGKNKVEYASPTLIDIFNLENDIPIPKKELMRWFGAFGIKDPSEEFAKNNVENLARQDKVMEVIKLRSEKFNYHCGLIIAGTGVGKTIISMKIARYYECNTLVLVSNLKLLQETVDRFYEMTGMKVGMYGDGKKEIEPITICTKKSFSTDYEKIANPDNKFETVIVDECHEGFSDAFRLALNKSFKQANLYGMTSTPFTPELETEDFEKYFGRKIDVKDKYDYTPDFEIIDYKPGKVCIQGKETSEYVYENYAELRGLMAEDTVRFEYQFKKLKELYNSRKCIIVLTDRVAESNNFYNRLAKGDTTKFNLIQITGETDIKDDAKAVANAISNGLKTIIVGTIQKIGTGFDIPPADTIFLVSAIKWKSRTEQAVGRILRKYDKLNPLAVIWNDEALKGQKMEKEKTIKKVYGVEKSDIKFFQIGDHRMPHEKMNIDFIDITGSKN